MTRIIGIGDSHFGPGVRNADRYASIDQIIAWGTSQPIGAWLHAGDLNHGKMTIEDRNELVHRFQRMADHAPVCLVVGNHDVDGDCRVFSKLQAKYPIVVIEAPGVYRIALATGGQAAVFGVPYVHRGGLVAAGVEHDQLGQVARQMLDPIFVSGASQLEKAIAAGDLPVFLAHLAIGGAVMSTGQPSIGREIEIDPALLARLGSIPKILGHIHRHQQIHDAWYLGSIAKNDFGENEEKVFGVLDFESPMDWSIAFEPLAVAAQHLVEGRLSPDRFAIHAVDGTPTHADDFPKSWAGSDVKVRYTYNRSEHSILDEAHILAEFAGCRSLKLDPIAEVEREVRAPEVVEAVTVDAKAEAYCGRKGITYTPALAAKLTALQQQTPEAILATVQTLAATAGQAPQAEPRKAVA